MLMCPVLVSIPQIASCNAMVGLHSQGPPLPTLGRNTRVGRSLFQCSNILHLLSPSCYACCCMVLLPNEQGTMQPVVLTMMLRFLRLGHATNNSESTQWPQQGWGHLSKPLCGNHFVSGSYFCQFMYFYCASRTPRRWRWSFVPLKLK